ncbi:hypothetical protein CEXT_734281 [Caerostris extrusa]|uniref:Uncharacterized protein n=1 Tax=Caerostris extrusa TaxID=172846 RepID=A0AAV4UXP1_CAEEX|nr:hypothetical protein CEXT_734281 [Caerostris extrusa]
MLKLLTIRSVGNKLSNTSQEYSPSHLEQNTHPNLNETLEEYQFPFLPKRLPSRYPEDHNGKVPAGKQLSHNPHELLSSWFLDRT